VTAHRLRLRGRFLRRWGLLLGAAALAFVAAAGTVAVRGAARLEQGRALRAEGRTLAAIYVLGGAARMRAPFATAYRAATRELEAMAHDPTVPAPLQAIAHREVRRAVAARRVFEPDDPAALAHVAAAEGRPPPVSVEPVEGTGRFDPVRATAAALCFVLWMGATLRFFRIGLDARLRLRPAAVPWGIVWLLLLLGWTLLTRFSVR